MCPDLGTLPLLTCNIQERVDGKAGSSQLARVRTLANAHAEQHSCKGT